MQTAASLLILTLLAGFIFRLHLLNRTEVQRRAAMPKEERETLERDDAVWSQRYGF